MDNSVLFGLVHKPIWKINSIKAIVTTQHNNIYPYISAYKFIIFGSGGGQGYSKSTEFVVLICMSSGNSKPVIIYNNGQDTNHNTCFETTY